jgi:hypothetical protein
MPYLCGRNNYQLSIFNFQFGNMAQRFYHDMTAEQQTRWVNEFATIIVEHGERIVLLGKGREAMKTEELPWVRDLFGLLSAWPFASDFCDKAMRYGDFSARTGRLSVYVDKVKDALADGLVMTDASGNKVAFVSPSTPLRRRGRPTKEEVAARLRGDTLVLPDDSPENAKRRAIAKMLGLEVIVSGEAPREKNNAELKAEREAKKAEFERQNPSLFGGEADGGNDARNNDITSQRNNEHTAAPAPISMGEIYQDRIENDRLHLSDIKWLCTKELQERIDMVRAQRTAFGDAAQTAKVLAERGASQDEIAVYAKQAEEAREAYESTYAAVDDELAVLHKRLSIDLPYVEQFKTRFKGVDIEKMLYITRPYYEKVRKEDPALDARIKRLIEQDSPEYAAKMKAEEEKKQEVADLLRYIKRKDKPNVKQRIETMEKRYARLVELLGEEEAKVYRPIVDAAIEDYEQNHKKEERPTPDPSLYGGEKKDAAVNKPTKQESKVSTKKETKPASKRKAASKREQGDAGISHAEREQARRDNGKKAAK